MNAQTIKETLDQFASMWVYSHERPETDKLAYQYLKDIGIEPRHQARMSEYYDIQKHKFESDRKGRR